MRRWLAALVTGILLLAGACSSSSDQGAGPSEEPKSQTPLDAVLLSAARTAEAKSSNMRMTMDMRGMPGIPGGALTVTSEGAFDYSTRQGTLTMNLPPMGGLILGRIEGVITPSAMYFKYPPEIAQSLGGKPWMKMEFSRLGELAGVDINSLMQGPSSDPTKSLEMLKGAGADVVEVGKEQIRGVETTRYKGTVDPNKAAAAAPMEQQAAMAQLAEIYGQSIPVEVWVDGEDRLRKLVMAVDLSKMKIPAKAGVPVRELGGSMTLDMELFDFGTDVNVAIPPADQVTDISQLMAQLGGTAQSGSASATRQAS